LRGWRKIGAGKMGAVPLLSGENSRETPDKDYIGK